MKKKTSSVRISPSSASPPAGAAPLRPASLDLESLHRLVLTLGLDAQRQRETDEARFDALTQRVELLEDAVHTHPAAPPKGN